MTEKEARALYLYLAELWEQVPLWAGDVDHHAALFLRQLTARYRSIIRMRGETVPPKLRNLPVPAPIVPLRRD